MLTVQCCICIIIAWRNWRSDFMWFAASHVGCPWCLLPVNISGQEELLRELRRPSPETLMMQRDLERARENLRQEQVVFEQQKQLLESRLKDEVRRFSSPDLSLMNSVTCSRTLIVLMTWRCGQVFLLKYSEAPSPLRTSLFLKEDKVQYWTGIWEGGVGGGFEWDGGGGRMEVDETEMYQ